MDADKPRSSVPIDVTVESDKETVECGGTYSAVDGGFVLAFSIGDGKYEITHTDKDTVLSVSGLLSYRISFAAKSAVKIDSPFGAVDVIAEPISRKVVHDGGSVVAELKYNVAVGGGRTERDVKVTARFRTE